VVHGSVALIGEHEMGMARSPAANIYARTCSAVVATRKDIWGSSSRMPGCEVTTEQ
jgi:hypothetical protein